MIYFNADIRSAHARSDDSITSGSVGIPVALALDSAFNGLAKTLCFKTATASVDIALVGDATESAVPPDVISTAGEWLYIGIYAADGDGDIVIPTVWANVGKIEQGTIPSGVDPSEPTPSWVAQVQNIASEALETANSVREDADSGKFDGEPGEAGANGTTFIPNVDAAGNISWTNNGDLPNPEQRNIMGPKGDTFTYADLTDADKADLVQGPIAEAQTAAVNAVNSAGTSNVSAVNSAGTTQVSNVNQAGDTQAAAVEQKGEEALAELQEYADLPEDVTDLKSAINFFDDIPGTVQTVNFDANGNPSSIVHTANGEAVRTDSFTWGVNTVTEKRELADGSYITFVTDLTTLVTTISEIQEA